MNNQLILTIKHTYFTHLKSKSFWWMVLGPFILLIVGATIGAGFTFFQNDSPATVAVINQSTIRTELKQQQNQLNIRISTITDDQTAQQALKKDKIDAILKIGDNQATLITQPKSNRIDQDQLQNFLKQLSLQDRAQQYGLNTEQINAITNPYKVTGIVQDDHHSQDSTSNAIVNGLLTTGVSVIIMIIVMTYASIIANEIANEKSSRIMETLLAASSAHIQYLGKIIGIIALLATQLLAYLLAGTGTYLVARNQPIFQQGLKLLSSITPLFLIYTICCILIATSLYLVLAAITASLVNDNSQIQQALSPITMLAMIPYLIGALSGSMGNQNGLIKVLSYIPFMSQSLMPGQLANHQASWLQAIISLVLAALTLIALTHYGEKLYAKNVLSYSDENITKQLLQAFRKVKH
ncbi:ABC transporter permease [Convivina praedatoris]|uniref:ABC-2 type transporter transmembrane domain-containing protein n=1 Tax=Convivina praedatoris TaxID=2880963 RepID=A0ABN8H7H3_9LACO|nr:ABC transporter permease [Convivina sp. LMG 32447]CAH1849915.1 putative protein YhaP [Convivina sp. LMG 32447]CAH1851271.1 putative protein YhaP [Convivina sp. LMG 32447]CAH1851287.1 putative protein YhaP [Convivina sp. LMG 32447]